MKVVSFKIDEDLDELLEETARKKNISKSELIRRAIREYLRNNDYRPYITKRVRVW